MLNSKRFREILNGNYHYQIKIFIAEAVKDWNNYQNLTKYQNFNRSFLFTDEIVLQSCGVLEKNNFGGYFIDFDYLNKLDPALIGYYIDEMEHKDHSTPVAFVAAGILVSGVELLKRERLKKLKRLKGNDFSLELFDLS